MNKIKKLINTSLVCLMMFGLFSNLPTVFAIDFSKEEDKYIKLCSSSRLSNGKQETCRAFNKYLKEKNSRLKENLKSNQQEIESTKSSIESVSIQLSNLTDEISKKENEITYLNGYINNLQNDIKNNESKIKDRMYSMQTYVNDNSIINFIFGANSLSEVFSRIYTVNELTASDKNLISNLNTQKSELNKQQTALSNQKDVLATQKNQQQGLRTKYQAMLDKQKEIANKTSKDIAQNEKQQSTIDAALQDMMKQTAALKAARQKALVVPKKPTTPNRTNPIENSNGAGKQGQLNDDNAGDSTIKGINIANAALAKQGARYWWGAQGPSYFDCSGLVYWAHNQAGIKIGRDTAHGYSRYGKPVSRDQLQAGDIITFDWNRDGHCEHIGIYIGNNMFVEAHGVGSSTVGQKPDETVQVSYLAGRFASSVYNYRRLY